MRKGKQTGPASGTGEWIKKGRDDYYLKYYFFLLCPFKCMGRYDDNDILKFRNALSIMPEKKRKANFTSQL